MTTTINYIYSLAFLEPYDKCVQGAEVYSIVAPNGNYTQMDYNWWDNDVVDGDYTDTSVYEYIGAPGSGNQYIYMKIVIGAGPNSSGYATSEDVYAAANPTQVYQQNTYEMTHNANYFVESPSYSVYKQYDPFQQSLLYQTTWTSRTSQGYWSGDQMTGFSDWGVQNQTYTYNFQGNPLSEVDSEYQAASDYSTTAIETGVYVPVSQTKEYAYWDSTRYYQQKAVVDRITSGNPRGRISYTDYWQPADVTAGKTQGGIGSVAYTYSDPYANWNTSLPGTTGWQGALAPAGTSPTYSSMTEYDPQGRATYVYKLQNTNQTPPSSASYSYVETSTTYGGDQSPWWGEPKTVVEDVGTGSSHFNRTTQTLDYDSSGHAWKTQDAAGHVFTTTYANLDGQVAAIDETDSGTIHLVTYAYGSGITNGQVTSVTDMLNNVSDAISYDPTATDPGYGMPNATTESLLVNGSWQTQYTVAYVYTPAADRGTTTYTTPNGTTTWQYDNYSCFGLSRGAPSRAPQTMRLLQSGSPTPEEFHYIYDGGGSLMASAFGMTPESGFTPTSGNPWYDPADPASYRDRALYDNFAGEIQSLDYYWESWHSGTAPNYSSNGLCSYSYSYDPTTLLKTGAVQNDASGTTWSYTYDPVLDYLTTASSNNAGTTSWVYDAAGNRGDPSNLTGWQYDNLNRLANSPGLTYSNDILGNRLSNSVSSQTWDQLNRMISFTPGGTSPTTMNYSYRADGLRTQKYTGTSPNQAPVTTYAYDGQMGFEDVDYASGAISAVTDYAIGARGMDRMAKTVSGATTVVYPIYDGHGSMTGTIGGGTTQPSVGNERSYDAWGNILGGSGSGDPKGRYCANLGHKQDDESGLIYMRARFYDPEGGRFLSQDPSKQGGNWFSYCNDSPVSLSDATGTSYMVDFFCMGLGLLLIVAGLFIGAAMVVILGALALIFGALYLWADTALTGYENKMKLLDAPYQGQDAVEFATLQIDNVKQQGGWTAVFAANLELDMWVAIALNGDC